MAVLLHGREYRNTLTKIEEAAAKTAGLVVVTGYSDDGVSFYGAISDEAGANNGAVVRLTGKGLLTSDCDCPDCPYFLKLRARAATIETHYSKDGYEWTYTTAIPHEIFDVMDHGHKFCRALVFALKDVTPAEL